MKIAYMMGSLNRGGAETLVMDILQNAVDADLDVMLIHRKKGDLYENLVSTGKSLQQLKPAWKIDPVYLWNLRKTLIKNKITLVHAQHPVDAFYALMACRGSTIKTALTHHGFNENKTGWYRRMLLYVMRNCAMNYFVSQSQLEDYTIRFGKLPAGKTRVIYNCIDFEKFSRAYAGNIRQELGISTDKPLLGSVGNFNHVRDQFTICRALKILKEKEKEFFFVFAGARQEKSARLYDRCVDYCRDNGLGNQVFFLGSRQDVPALLKQMEVFVYASNSDTFGIAVIEAMAAGVPVIVNNWKVMLEVTDQGRLGTIYPSGDHHSLADKLGNFIENKDAYLQKAKDAAIHVRKKYHVTSFLQNLKASYAEIADK
jgi:glycosyltransferase involved in cell wall biosynthesis